MFRKVTGMPACKRPTSGVTRYKKHGIHTQSLSIVEADSARHKRRPQADGSMQDSGKLSKASFLSLKTHKALRRVRRGILSGKHELIGWVRKRDELLAPLKKAISDAWTEALKKAENWGEKKESNPDYGRPEPKVRFLLFVGYTSLTDSPVPLWTRTA